MKISSLGNATAAAVSLSVWESFIELQSRGEQLDTLRRFVYSPLVMVGGPKFYICRHCNSSPSLSVNRDYLKESAYA